MAALKIDLGSAKRSLLGHWVAEDVTILGARIEDDYLILDLAGTSIPDVPEVIKESEMRQRTETATWHYHETVFRAA